MIRHPRCHVQSLVLSPRAASDESNQKVSEDGIAALLSPPRRSPNRSAVDTLTKLALGGDDDTDNVEELKKQLQDCHALIEVSLPMMC